MWRWTRLGVIAVVMLGIAVAGARHSGAPSGIPGVAQPALAAETGLCGQMPELLAAVDWTFQTWPPEQYDVDEQNLANLRYFRAMVQADYGWCTQPIVPADTALITQTQRWHFGNASVALRDYQASVQETSAPFTGTLGPVVAGDENASPVALLTDVRAAGHPGFDRTVFEFRDTLPPYRIEYVQPPVEHDASGEPVDIAGTAFLRVRFRPATGWDGEAGKPSYTGPSSIAPALPSLREVEKTGDFEATLTWVLGLSQQQRFRVIELQNPPRVVIDVLTP